MYLPILTLLIILRILDQITDIDLCTSGDCMSAPFSLWVALDILFVLIAAVLVVYGEVIKIMELFIPAGGRRGSLMV